MTGEGFSSVTSAGSCPGCGKPLKRGAGEGLCTACLLRRAMSPAGAADHASDAETDLIAAAGLEGRTLGGYEIISTLAQGGMGVVFRARQKNPLRVVALKVISAGELATRRMVERFHNEALAAARLSHPNIVPIYEVGADRGWHYFSMQLIEGRTLAGLIRQQPPVPEAAVRLLVKVARAVEHAHQRGILHRDLKPTNILLDARGEPHLTDFGLAKVAELDSDLTRSHAVLGTPAYMSPEQAAGKSRDITTATDVYGLGAILYELLTGRTPFTAGSTPELLRKIAEEEPERFTIYDLRFTSEDDLGTRLVNRKSSLVNRIPADLQVICLKCLEKSPAKRYATAGELADELERWLRHEPILARPAGGWERGRKWIRRNRARAALLASVALSGFALTAVSLLFNFRLDRARALAEASAESTRQALVRHQLHEASRLLEERRCFTALWPALEALRLGDGQAGIERSARRRIAGALQFSPRLLRLWAVEGPVRSLQFSEDDQVLTATLAGGRRQAWRLGPARDISPAELAALRFATNALAMDNLRSVTQERSNVIASFSANLGEGRAREVAIALTSPDGAWSVTASFDAGVRVTRLRDGQPLGAVLENPAAVTALAMRGDGRLLAVGSADGVVRVWDLAKPMGTMLERPLPVDRPIFLPGHDGLIVQLETGHLALLDPRDGKRLAGPFEIPAEPQMVARSADGRRLATTCTNGFMGVWDVASGRRLWELRLPAEWYSLDFSPDSQRLVLFGSGGALRCFEAETGREPFPGQQLPGSSRRVEWSGDGRWLLTTTQDGLRVWDAATGTLHQGPMGGEGSIFTARFSPDSRRVAATFAGSQLEPSAALMWELPSLQRSGPAMSHGDALRDLRFSADGQRIVTTGLDRSARLWWTATGLAAGPPMRHGGVVSFACFGGGDQMLVSGSADQTVKLWETATGEALLPPLSLPGPVHDGDLTQTGEFLAVRMNGWPGWLFEFRPEGRSFSELAELASLLTGEERDAGGVRRVVPAPELARRFAALLRLHPAEFAEPADDARWHGQQAVVAEKSADRHAADFHRQWLARLREARVRHPE
ncbi:MAG TPA: serine/threonine-protein kinase [Candidatus Limnocylindria bacterium]|nr:serine/threonine-protein kinase [Candidatus Limnocylindria bacterium]